LSSFPGRGNGRSLMTPNHRFCGSRIRAYAHRRTPHTRLAKRSQRKWYGCTHPTLCATLAKRPPLNPYPASGQKRRPKLPPLAPSGIQMSRRTCSEPQFCTSVASKARLSAKVRCLEPLRMTFCSQFNLAVERIHSDRQRVVVGLHCAYRRCERLIRSWPDRDDSWLRQEQHQSKNSTNLYFVSMNQRGEAIERRWSAPF
jgi:hypothetical protein